MTHNQMSAPLPILPGIPQPPQPKTDPSGSEPARRLDTPPPRPIPPPPSPAKPITCEHELISGPRKGQFCNERTTTDEQRAAKRCKTHLKYVSGVVNDIESETKEAAPPPKPAAVPPSMPRSAPPPKTTPMKVEEPKKPDPPVKIVSDPPEKKVERRPKEEKLPPGCQFVIDLPKIPEGEGGAGEESQEESKEISEAKDIQLNDNIDELYRDNPWLVEYIPPDEMDDPEEHVRRLRRAVRNRTIDNTMFAFCRYAFPALAGIAGGALGTNKLNRFGQAIDFLADDYRRLLTVIRQENEELIYSYFNTTAQFGFLLLSTAGLSAKMVAELEVRGLPVDTPAPTPSAVKGPPTRTPSDSGDPSAPGLGLTPSAPKPSKESFDVNSFFNGTKLG